MSQRTLRILGTRGVPAEHGGFETFAEHLALFLVERDWRVVVYRQVEGGGPIYKDDWQGVERVNIPVRGQGTQATVVFDGRATFHAAQRRDLCLTLGYNTAVFCALLRLRGVPNLINMDGIEWSRAKWGQLAKSWFWFNDWSGCWLGNHLVADHPLIADHLATRVKSDRITTIAYGADRLGELPMEPVLARGLTPGRYLSVIARPEPENSILEVVSAFSRRPRGRQLLVLGNYSPDNAYQRAVQAAASDEVLFAGAIYDKPVVQALRCHSLAYVHGHRVGGTNPSLVEAMGAGNAVFAHDNGFNRWVAGDGACYFSDTDSLAAQFDKLLDQPAVLERMQAATRQRFDAEFTWQHILEQYEQLLTRWLP